MTEFSKPQWINDNKPFNISDGKNSLLFKALFFQMLPAIILSLFMLKKEVQNLLIQEISSEPTLPIIVRIRIYGSVKTSKTSGLNILYKTKTLPIPSKLYQPKLAEI